MGTKHLDAVLEWVGRGDAPEEWGSALSELDDMKRALRDLREVAFDGPSEEKGGPGGETVYEWRQRIDRDTAQWKADAK